MKHLKIIAIVGLLILFFFPLYSEPKVTYGNCKEVSFGIITPFFLVSDPNHKPFFRQLLKLIEVKEVNSGGNVVATPYDVAETYEEKVENVKNSGGDPNSVVIPIARYHLLVKYKDPLLIGTMINDETCEVVMEEKITFKSLNSFNYRTAAEELFNELRQNYRNITARLTDQLKFGKVDYHDYKSKLHPASPKHALYSHEILLKNKMTGETINSSYFEPGDIMDIKITYLECDEKPIKNFNPIVEIINGSKDIKLKVDNIISNKKIELITNERGEVTFQVITTPDSEYRDIVLRIFKESNCEKIFNENVRENKKTPKYILDKKITIKSNEKWAGTLDVSLTSSLDDECLSGVSFKNLAFKFNIWFVIDWQLIELVLNQNPNAPTTFFYIWGKGVGVPVKKPKFSVIGDCMDGTIIKAEVPDRIDVEIGGGATISREVGLSIEPQQEFFYILVQDNEDPLELYYRSSFRPPCGWIGEGENPCPLPKVLTFFWDLRIWQDQNIQPWDLAPESLIKLQIGKKTAEKNGYVEIYYPSKGSYLIKLERVYK